jgi:GR25 family glycosyltransferase involved in LPS biosynthesis
MPDAVSPPARLDVDRVYVIHVRNGAEDRAASIELQLARLGIEFEYVLDGDCDQLTPEVMARWFRGPMATPTAESSCAFKHLTACERLVRDGRDAALVLEDDIMLPAGFVADLNRSIAELRTRSDTTPGIGCISLENTGLETFPPPPTGQTLVRADHGRAAGAYWLARGAAERLLRRAGTDRLQEPIDHFQNRLARTGEMEMWWRHPAIAEQGSHNGMFTSLLAPGRGGPLRRLKWVARKAWQHQVRPFLARMRPGAQRRSS